MAGVRGGFLEDEESADSHSVSTPMDTAPSTPDSTPSRRSSRRKQCHFSSDFEYYSPGARKKDVAEVELKLAAETSQVDGRPEGKKRGRKKGKQQQQQQLDVEDPIEGGEERTQAENRKHMTRKVAVKMQRKDKFRDSEEGSDIWSGMGRIKVAAKKVTADGRKAGRKNRLDLGVEVNARDEGSENEEDVETDDNKQVAGQKRKKTATASMAKGKKMKTELQVEDTSDNEVAEPLLGKTSIPKKMPKLKKQTDTSSPSAQYLMRKLAEVSSDTGSVSYLPPATGPKRKLGVSDGEKAVPLKTCRTAKKDKQALAAAGLIRRTPTSDHGVGQPLPAAMPAKTRTTFTKQKPSTAAANKAEDNSMPVSMAASISLKDEVKSEEAVLASKFVWGLDEMSEVASSKEDSGVKVVEKINGSGKVVQLGAKQESNGKHVAKGQGVRRPDGIGAKKKSLLREEPMMQSEDNVITGKGSKVKEVNSKKLIIVDERSKSQSVNVSGKKHTEKSPGGGKQNLKSMHGKTKESGPARSGPDGIKKHEGSSQKVDDLLKRGIFHKKKSHQPFGNRKVAKVTAKDVKVESAGDVLVKQDPTKKKIAVHKAEERAEVKKATGAERRKSGDGSKLVKGQSKKGERRKSENAKQSSLEEGIDDASGGPPVLIPATAIGKAKHRHHKVEHEAPLDMTMMDLFKPDALVIHDLQKKDIGNHGGKAAAAGSGSQYSVDVYDPTSFVKPENLHHVLIEHQYSKSSPVVLKQEHESNASTSIGIGRDDDIESVSHKQTVIMDMNLPDQILEESEEPVMELGTGESLEAAPPAVKDDLSPVVTSKDSTSCSRSSILESLGTELKEGGAEFRIVGHVEVGQIPAMAREESICTTQAADDLKQNDTLANNQGGGDKSGQVRKSETRKSSTEKRKDISDSQERAKRKKKRSKSDGSDDKNPAGDGGDEGEGESEEHHFEDDENDLDWEPNDPNTLYCICRMPHNNRFMICCDKCEEWFHGTCVGITKARGKEMEEKEEEYVCPLCSKRDGNQPIEQHLMQSKSADVGTPKPKLLQRCVARKCSKPPRPGSVYCSQECIMSHAQESLKALREDQLRKQTSEKKTSSESSKSPANASGQPAAASASLDTVEVVERHTGKVLKGSSAPTQKGLHQWLEQHPTYEVVQPSHRRHTARSSSSREDRPGDQDTKPRHELKPTDREHRTSADRDRKADHTGRSRHSSGSSSIREPGRRGDSERHASAAHKSDASSITPRSEEKKEDGPNQIRINVRTALRDCLSARAQEAPDITLSSADIKNLAVTIEEQLFDLFNDTGHKYRTKYRSLVFNIKDQKNKGLFRKILTGKITPHKLVQMSTEELASRELAKWREQASKHELEMIEKTEQEAMKESETAKHVIKKTHKGEVEVVDEDLSMLETRLEERKEPEPEPQEEQASGPAIDTTDQHRAHLFDLNCKVCTGRIVPGPEEQAAIAAGEKSVVVAMPKTQVEPAPESSDMEKIDFEKAEEIVKEALETVQKMEQSVMSMGKIVSLSPKLEEAPAPLSPKLRTPRRESSSSASSSSSSSTRKKVVVRSPDSALQAGLESKIKFSPTDPMLWKGFISMLDVAKFFTSAYRVSGPTDYVVIPDTVHILGRISPEHMWDYLSKIRQAGSKDVTVIRFVPDTNEEKVAYVHLYSYLNSRGRCGVAGNPDKQVKDFYLVPLASHSKIPRALLPFDGPGLEENRPHMLLGILVRQRGKHGGEANDASSSSSSNSSTGSGRRKSTSQSQTPTGATTKPGTPPASRDPRLAKHATKGEQPKMSPEESPKSGAGVGEVRPKSLGDSGLECITSPVVSSNASKSVAELASTHTPKAKDEEDDKIEGQTIELKMIERHMNEGTPLSDESSSRDDQDEKNKQHHLHKDHHHHHHHHYHHQHHREHHHHLHHHHNHHKKAEKEAELADDSEPYSPSKEAEPYSPSQEAAADEPYDPGDETMIDDTGVPILTSLDVSSSTSSGSVNVTTTIEAASAVAATVAGASYTSQEFEGNELTTSRSDFVEALHGESMANTSDLVEQMAQSNDPQVISGLMVTALSAATSSQEQQKLLVELTKKVEERKLQLAEAARQGAAVCLRRRSSENAHGRSDPPAESCGEMVTGEVVSSSRSLCSSDNLPLASHSGHGGQPLDAQNVLEHNSSSSSSSVFSLAGSSSHSSHALPGLTGGFNTGCSKLLGTEPALSHEPPLSAPASHRPASGEAKETAGIKFSFTKSRIKPSQVLSTSTSEVFSTMVTESKPRLSMLHEDLGQQGSVTSEADHPGSIPHALKAARKEAMSSTADDKLLLLLKAEVEKAVKGTVDRGQEATTERQLLSKLTESYKLITSEEMTKTSDQKPHLSVTFDSAAAGNAVVGLGNSHSQTDGQIGERIDPAPSVDELLDKLKKGGFQFKQTESSRSSALLSVDSSAHPSTPASIDIQCLSVAEHSVLSPCYPSTTTLPSSCLNTASDTTSSATLTQNTSLWPRHSISSSHLAPVTLSSDSRAAETAETMHSQRPGVGDHDKRMTPGAEGHSVLVSYQVPPAAQINPLDALPPLPADPYSYPPLPPSLPPTLPPSLPPTLPPPPLRPPLESHVPFQPVLRLVTTPQLPEAPALPTTDHQTTVSATGAITHDFRPQDVDFRDRKPPPFPPLPPENLPPAAPAQPSFPTAVGSQHPHPPHADVDYRSKDSHHSHQDYPQPGNRPIHRH